MEASKITEPTMNAKTAVLVPAAPQYPPLSAPLRPTTSSPRPAETATPMVQMASTGSKTAITMEEREHKKPLQAAGRAPTSPPSSDIAGGGSGKT